MFLWVGFASSANLIAPAVVLYNSRRGPVYALHKNGSSKGAPKDKGEKLWEGDNESVLRKDAWWTQVAVPCSARRDGGLGVILAR